MTRPDPGQSHRRRLAAAALLPLLLPACGWPTRAAVLDDEPDSLALMPGFEDVRAVDGYPSEAIQTSFDQSISKLAATTADANGRRTYDMLVLSSGGVNGAFGAGVLTGWTHRGDRPSFWFVTGVSVGALMAPFAFAGPQFDDRIEELFRRISPGDLHHEKGVLGSVLWDESLMDNSPLREAIRAGADEELMAAVAAGHAEGRRCFVGSTNLDMGHFVVWDLGAIASRGTPEALELFRSVLQASASIPVVYPPVRFRIGDGDELHADGAIVRPMFIPQNVFDGYASADRAGISWDDVDATLYVVQNGSLRPTPVTVQRETLAIATRTVTMMSYTMVSEHVLHLYMLARAWGAEFRFMNMPDGLELSIDGFGPDDTEELFELAQGLVEGETPWRTAPPGFVFRADLQRITPEVTTRTEPPVQEQLRRIQQELRALRQELRDRDGGRPRPAPLTSARESASPAAGRDPHRP